MKFSLLNKSYPTFGMHLNGTALKFIQLEQKGGKFHIIGYSNVPMKSSLIASDEILDSDGLANLISKSLLRPDYGKITSDRAILSIPESKSFIRVIKLPLIDEEKADNAVMLEAEAYIPLPIDQVYFDWQVIERRSDEMEILIIASPKDFVDKYLRAVDKAGLKTVAMEVEPQAIVRVLVESNNKENVLIADIDAFKTSLIMVEQGQLQFTSSVPIAGNTFTDKVGHGLGLDQPKAEALKREVGIANTPQYPNLKTFLLPAVEDLSAEINNILKFHYDHSSNIVSKLILSGGSAKLKNLQEELAPYLTKSHPELSLATATPLKYLENLTDSNLTDYESLSYVVAIGLAMRGFK